MSSRNSFHSFVFCFCFIVFFRYFGHFHYPCTKTADRALGNDGNIGLPYCDWTVRPEDGLPSIIGERLVNDQKIYFQKILVKNHHYHEMMMQQYHH